MLISKFDLYKTEWLDLVFDHRNKEYGAYDLRHHYAGNMVKAMGITFSGVALLCGAVMLFSHNEMQQSRISQTSIPVTIQPPPPIAHVKPPEAPAHVKPLKPQAPAPTVTTTKDVQMVVKPDIEAVNPPKNIDLKGNIGTENLKGTTDISVPDIDPGPKTGTPTSGNDNTVHLPGTLDVMPEPVGGMNAWSKFLGKNLRFPPAAQEDGLSGKVILSFIIEKDGTLSNITVDRPAGHGFDEEALRVLKLAKAWKPGMQNGQAVRVKYSIPINFQLSTE